MLNFLTNVFHEKSNGKNMCAPQDDVIQGCIGCDAGCSFFCEELCSSTCMENTQGGSGDGKNCNSHCTGTCFSVASIIGGK